MELQQGANTSVDKGVLTVGVELAGSAGLDVDVSAYLLGADDKVRGDHDMVFYNQKEGAAGAVRLTAQSTAGTSFEIDLPRLPAEIARIAFCLTVDQPQAGGPTVGSLGAARIVVRSGAAEAASFTPKLAGATEAAMIFGELYRRNDEWKFRAVGQGFNGGLGPLARSFGIQVDDEPPAPPLPPPAPARAAPPPSAGPINLSKVTLDKPGQSVSLHKRGNSFGEIVINLNWSRGKKGLFGGGGDAVDLDLGCLYEMRDGSISAVQAIGKRFGSLTGAPFIALDGDDRTGDVSKGETLRINGAHWNEIKRVAVFAHIYKGAPNWRATDGVVNVTMPDQPPIEIRLTEGSNDRWLCGVVLLENDGGALKATRLVRYYVGREQLDRDLHWGINWVPMRKE